MQKLKGIEGQFGDMKIKVSEGKETSIAGRWLVNSFTRMVSDDEAKRAAEKAKAIALDKARKAALKA